MDGPPVNTPASMQPAAERRPALFIRACPRPPSLFPLYAHALYTHTPVYKARNPYLFFAHAGAYTLVIYIYEPAYTCISVYACATVHTHARRKRLGTAGSMATRRAANGPFWADRPSALASVWLGRISGRIRALRGSAFSSISRARLNLPARTRACTRGDPKHGMLASVALPRDGGPACG